MTDTSTKNGSEVSMHEAREATLRWLMGFERRGEVIPEMVSAATGLPHERAVGALYDLSRIEDSGLTSVPGRRATYAWKRWDASPVESHRRTQEVLDAEPEVPEPEAPKAEARASIQVRDWVRKLDQPRRFNARELANALKLDYEATALALRSMALCGSSGIRQAKVRTSWFYFNPDAYVPTNDRARVQQERINLVKEGLVPLEVAMQAFPEALTATRTYLERTADAGNRVSYVNGPSQAGRQGRAMWVHPRWFGKEPLIGPVVVSKISEIPVGEIRDKMKNGTLPSTNGRVSPNDMEAFMETLTRDPETEAPETEAPSVPAPKPKRTPESKAKRTARTKAARAAKANAKAALEESQAKAAAKESAAPTMPVVTFRDTDILVVRDADGTSSAWRPL